MKDLSLTAANDTASESRAEGIVRDDDIQSLDGAGRDFGGCEEDPAFANTRLAEEIKSIQQRLYELEKEARQKLDERTLEAGWARAREELGPEEEKKAWIEEKRRRKARLIAANPLRPGTKGDCKYNYEAQYNIDEEFAYNIKLFNIRKRWERRIASSIDSDQDSDYTDSDHDDELSGYEERAYQMQLLKRVYEMESESITRDHEMRQLRRRIRRRALERRFDHGTGEGVGPSDEEEPAEDVSTEDTTKIVEKTIDQDARPELIRVTWDTFKALRGLEEGRSAAIDVLTEEPIIEFNTSSYERRYQAHRRKSRAAQVQEREPAPKQQISTLEAPIPERLRINSRRLLQILLDIHKSDEKNFRAPSLVLLRPFRILNYYNEAIRELYEKFKDASPGDGLISDNNDLIRGNHFDLRPLAQERADNGNATSPVSFEHLKCLVEFMDKDMRGRIRRLESERCQKVLFSDLWYFFQPGVIVIGNDSKQAYRILTMHSTGHRVTDPLRRWYDKSVSEEEEASIIMKCVYIDFDGKQLGPVSKVFRISRFEREKAVTSLDIYPLRFHPLRKECSVRGAADPGDGFRTYLVDRGRMFLKAAAVNLAAIQPMYYAGPALQTQDEIESQVVVDFEAAFAVEEHISKGWRPELKALIENREEGAPKRKKCSADCCASEVVHDDSYVETKRNEEFMCHLLPKTGEEMPSVAIVPRPLDTKTPEAELAEDDLVIMSYRVFGFVLRNRKWAQLDLSYLSEVQPPGAKNVVSDDDQGDGRQKPRTVFDQLVLPQRYKDVILSLVTQHFRDKEASCNGKPDIVRGKGKGLILLLHGAPGVGKTTTAEGVAERFKKPLFQLTCGDLGTTAKDVEAALEKNFALASRWGCILLLDEADVFLAQRTKEDFQRNGLVAVFLRVLEYYAGILFLTTNRVGDFDEAFASRIHISLYYPELGRDETREVFKLNLQLIRDRFHGEARKIILDDMDIGAFAENHWKETPLDRWNGRQIRNACQTALALAEYETSNPDADLRLDVRHFQAVAETYLAFSNHLKDIYGTHAARRAKEAGLRAMWVNEQGEVAGNVGPKEANMSKASRRSRYLQKSQGQYPAYEPQHQAEFSTGPTPRHRERDIWGGAGQDGP